MKIITVCDNHASDRIRCKNVKKAVVMQNYFDRVFAMQFCYLSIQKDIVQTSNIPAFKKNSHNLKSCVKQSDSFLVKAYTVNVHKNALGKYLIQAESFRICR